MRLLHEPTGKAVKLGGLRDTRALWQLLSEARAEGFSDAEIGMLVAALLTVLPAADLVGRPSRLTRLGVVAHVVTAASRFRKPARRRRGGGIEAPLSEGGAGRTKELKPRRGRPRRT